MGDEGGVKVTVPVPQSWPEAERIWRSDARWLGSDCAYSVALAPGRTLWLFGDTFVAPRGASPTRDHMVFGNTIAIMAGADPSSAEIRFYWDDAGALPGPFFPAPNHPGTRQPVLWPGGGIMLGRRLLLFFFIVDLQPSDGSWFKAVGWTASVVENPGDNPEAWTVTDVVAPQNSYEVLVGSAQVLVHEDRLYAYSAGPRNDGYLVRWPIVRAEQADLSEPEWWCGSAGWVEQAVGTPPAVVLPEAQTEFTVHVDAATGDFIQVQGSAIDDARMLWRRAPRPEGPWSEPVVIYDPPERRRKNVILYAFKVHPQLAGGDLVATYATHGGLANPKPSADLYYPRFVRLTL